uniref:Uncharacterized protein n=1 Tax=Candidatus Kentrum sp. LPFa TaxID=2126335 RepID=A0A450WD97_9GAMM|nr:MAG: hypothetical protein BECKLPF1236B_GA0070989_10714 [Candidatus Kentron sp. LPFa]
MKVIMFRTYRKNKEGELVPHGWEISEDQFHERICAQAGERFFELPKGFYVDLNEHPIEMLNSRRLSILFDNEEEDIESLVWHYTAPGEETLWVADDYGKSFDLEPLPPE